MAALQKFKFFATNCAVIGNPTRGPTSSPLIHIRRRKTLRMLFTKTTASNAGAFQRRRADIAGENNPPEAAGCRSVRSKLKDLFVSPPPPSEEEKKVVVAAVVRGGGGGVRGLSATVRQRLLLRRGWRPVLVPIPEVSP